MLICEYWIQTKNSLLEGQRTKVLEHFKKYKQQNESNSITENKYPDPCFYGILTFYFKIIFEALGFANYNFSRHRKFY